MSQLQQQLQQKYQQTTITIDQFYRLQHRAKTEITNLIDASIPNKEQNRALKSLVDGIFENMNSEAGKASNDTGIGFIGQSSTWQNYERPYPGGLQAQPAQSPNLRSDVQQKQSLPNYQSHAESMQSILNKINSAE